MAYTNSPLVTYTKLSPNKNVNRKYPISRFTPHCIVGQWTAKKGCDYFYNVGVNDNPNDDCSANYVVGLDGKIGLSVEEKDRAWTSSSSDNDHRAITVEVASDTTAPYKVTDEAWNGLIELAVDVCQRNGKTKMIWLADKNKSLNYQPKDNEMLITVHRWFANKSCPGEYLYNRLGELADTVNKRLANNGVKNSNSTSNDIKAGDKVGLASNAVQFNGKTIPASYMNKEYIVKETSTSGRTVLTLNGVVMYAVDIKYLISKEPKVEQEFKEGHEPSDYAKEAWKKAMNKGVTDGTNPKNNITREQLMVILDRLGQLD